MELVRLLEGNKLQFEDQLTRLVTTFTLTNFHSMLQAGHLIPVLAEEAPQIAGRPQRVVLDLSSLSEKDRAQLERRMSYVRALRKRLLTRGQRSKVGKARRHQGRPQCSAGCEASSSRK
jgi:hypothetical protein